MATTHATVKSLSTELIGQVDELLKINKSLSREVHELRKCIRHSEDTIRLNVGGMYFVTSLSRLRGHCAYFVKWPPAPDTDVYFVDRNPKMFGVMLDFIRDGEIDLSIYSESHLRILDGDATFYKLHALTAKLANRGFQTRSKRMARISRDGRTVMNGEMGTLSGAISARPFTPGHTQWSVRINRAEGDIYIGVAPKSILNKISHEDNCGWYISKEGELHGQATGIEGEDHRYRRTYEKPYMPPIETGSIIRVTMCDGSISFAVDGVDGGVAWTNVDKSVPLYLTVLLSTRYNYDTLLEDDVISVVEML